MAHAEPRSTPRREGAIGVLTGATYGVVHTLSGHPLDNVKARLQLDPGFHRASSAAAIRAMWAEGGLRAFFRGCLHPMWGSAIYRAVMISGYEGCYTWFEQTMPEDSVWKAEYLGCVRPMVVASAVATTLARVVVEAPIEQSKVMRQTGRAWEWHSLYRGVAWQTVRTAALLTLIFVPYDAARRKAPELFRSMTGQLAIVSSVCAFSYAAAWPLETLKNCAQAGVPSPGASLYERVRFLGGLRGLYRGAGPGVLCGALRNGCAMLAMNGLANPLATRLGLRDVEAG